MSNSDTPRTDAPKYEQHHESIWERHKDGRRFLMLGEVADLLNGLEREIAGANKATERAKAYKRVLKDENARLKVELSNCQSGNRSLAQSLDEAREQRDEWFSVANLKNRQLGDLKEQRDALAGA